MARPLLLLSLLALGCAEGKAPPGEDPVDGPRRPSDDGAVDLAAPRGDGAAPDLTAPGADLTTAADGGPDGAGGPSCQNQVRDGQESDIDCGGTCPPCLAGRRCNGHGDCAGGTCQNGQCSLPPGLAAPVGIVANEPDDLVAGDLDGDGKIDLVTANRKLGVCVLLGKGGNAFAPPACVPAGKNPVGLTAGDWNGDGKIDLATANRQGNDTAVLLGRGDGTFGAARSFGGADYPAAVTTADLDGNGKLDLLLASTSLNPIGGEVTVLLGQGDGSFLAATSFPTRNPLALFAGDLTGDGKADVVVANFGTPETPDGTLSVLAGNGLGALGAPMPYAAGKYPAAVLGADLNGDGKLDLVAASRDSDSVSVLLSDGKGGLAAPRQAYGGDLPGDLVSADFDRDGKLDLAVAGWSDTVTLLLGKGDGTFQPPRLYPVAKNPRALVAADFDRDGKVDLAVANSGSGDIALLRNTF